MSPLRKLKRSPSKLEKQSCKKLVRRSQCKSREDSPPHGYNPAQLEGRQHRNWRGALNSLPQHKWSLNGTWGGTPSSALYLRGTLSTQHNLRGAPSKLLQIQRNPEFATITWEDPKPSAAAQEEAQSELKWSSESPA